MSGVNVSGSMTIAVGAAVAPAVSVSPCAGRAREVASGSGFCAEVMKVALDNTVPLSQKRVFAVTSGETWSLVVRDGSSFKTIAEEDDFAAINEIALTLEKCNLTSDRVYATQDIIDATKDEELKKAIAIQATQVLSEADRKLAAVISSVVDAAMRVEGPNARRQFLSIAGEHARHLTNMPTGEADAALVAQAPATGDEQATYFDESIYLEMFDTLASDAQVRSVERHERGLAAKKIEDFTNACEDVSETVDTMLAVAEAAHVAVPAKKTRSAKKTVFGGMKAKDTKEDIAAKVIAKHYAAGMSNFRSAHGRVVPAVNTTNAQEALISNLLSHTMIDVDSDITRAIHNAMTATFANERSELVDYITQENGYRVLPAAPAPAV